MNLASRISAALAVVAADVREARGVAASAALAYDGAGRLSTVTYADGRIKTLGYDGAGRLSTVTLTRPGEPTKTKSLAYDGAGKLSSVSIS